MTIKEVEEQTGLSRSNLRFYEKEKLIHPARNEKNDYREYSQQDVEEIKKIAYLRTLGISVESIYRIINKEMPLMEAVQEQAETLDKQVNDLEQARAICAQMLAAEPVSYEELDVEAYVPEMPAYVAANPGVFRVDSVSFLYLWGGVMVWGILAAVSLLAALIFYPGLPDKIPVQWADGEISNEVNRIFIFAYPVFCVILRRWLRPYLAWKLQIPDSVNRNLIADYVTNFFCFVILSVEIFSVLYLHHMVKHVTVLLAVDAAVFFGLLLVGLMKKSVTDR